MRILIDFLALALFVGVAEVQAAPMRANDADPRWQTFVGCWTTILEAGAEGVQDHVLCFREDKGGGVMIVTLVDDLVQNEEVIVADGTAHPLQRESCSGSGTATWSADGTRVYLSSTLRCGDDGLGRESAGVLALADDRTLIDLRTVGAEDQYGVRTLRYRRLTPAEYPASMRDLASETDEAVLRYGAAPLSLDDVVEVSGLLPSAAVEAMLVELPSRIRADAETLVALAEAGVDDEVIDVVVALAYPDQFAMAEAPLTDEYVGAGVMSGPYYDPWMGYGGYGYNRYYGYGYSPFGYPYGLGFGGGTVIIVDRDEAAESGSPGTAVKGRGYTRADDDPGSGGGRAKPRRESSRSSVDRSSRDRSTSRSSPSSGGDSGSSRKAQPRQPSGDS